MFATSDHMLQCPPRPLMMERRWKSNAEIAPNCPRRYWTKGGSLRNVPVGGGCRKSRRAKLVPSSPNERVAMSNVRSPPSPGLSTDNQAMVPPSGTVGSDIDLAAVFAKFLNQNSSFEDSELVRADSSEFPDQANASFDTQLEDVMIECQKQYDLIEDANLFVVDNQHDEEKIEEFMGNDQSDFGLQTFLNGEVEQDVLWSEPTSLLPNFSWQPMGQLQELASFPSDDQSKISTNLIGDCWNSFDLSAYEVFPRP
ncbi:hypothetical protein F0562_027872 [Nyssa sinensis]|uniref:Dof-type domain-containing protein n=1 Tax=Nyssa sinensis TaxID=561372 RepID=A0A5J5B4X9_9ASTE|nr:hypothetical protein F0562_027872 [Nyssa sinensis]